MTEEPTIPWDEGSGNEIFENLANAFLRLLRNEPIKHLPFVEQVEEGVRIKVTQLNVALEADEHRQRFEDFPRLARLIKTYRPTHGTVEKTTEKLKKRADKIGDLTTLLTLALSRQAEAIAIADELRGELTVKEGEIGRLKTKLKERGVRD